MEQREGCSLGQVLTVPPGPWGTARVGEWGKEDGGCRGACKDLGFMHPSEEHHSVPEHTGGELLHSVMQKTIIHKIILPAAVINHYVTPLVSPKPAPAQPSKCPGTLQATRKTGEMSQQNHTGMTLSVTSFPPNPNCSTPPISHDQLCRGAVSSPHVPCDKIPALSVQFTTRTKQNAQGGC